MLIKYSFRFLQHKRKGNESHTPLLMRFRMDGKSFDIFLGISLPLDAFSPELQQPIGNTKEANEARRLMAELSTITTDTMQRYELIEKRKPSIDEVKTLILDHLGRVPVAKGDTMPISEAYRLFLTDKERFDNIADRSLYNYRIVISSLIRQCKDKSIADLCTDDIVKYFDNMIQRGMRNSSIEAYSVLLKHFITWCGKKGYCSAHIMDDMRMRLKSTTGEKALVYLTIEELRTMENADIEKALQDFKAKSNTTRQYLYAIRTLKDVRDAFVFCCYTSLRYSDIKKLKRTDCTPTSIRTVTQKTSDAINIELNAHAKAILERHLASGDECPFNVHDSKIYNGALRLLCEMLGFDRTITKTYYTGGKRVDEVYKLHEVVTSHSARKTFVVTALQLGIPSEVIMRWTGHSNFETLRPYVAIVDKLKRDSMAKFDEI